MRKSSQAGTSSNPNQTTDSSAQSDFQDGGDFGSGFTSQSFDQLGDQALVTQAAAGGTGLADMGSASNQPSDASANGLTTDIVAAAGGGIVFNNTFTANCTQAYENCIIAAEQAIQAQWSNPITLNLKFDAQARGTNGTFLATNSWPTFVFVTYAQLTSALASHDSGSSFAQAAVASLPSSDPNPAGGSDWALPEAYARMLGLSSTTYTYDDTITLNTSYNWSYGQDVTDAVEHEISEGGMGRVGGLGDQNGVWSTMDLFRYSAVNTRDYSDGRDGAPTYFSVDGSQLLLQFNNQYNGSTQVNTGDTADFSVHDVFGTGSTGEANTFSATDLEVMDILGWSPPPPTLYDFKFTYTDGSYYYGTVADDGTYGYHVGETINGTSSGSYNIYASAGTTSEAVGTVYDTSYYDVTSHQTYAPAYGSIYPSYGYMSGTNGLNQDFDYIRSGDGPWVAFGDGGTYEAKMGGATLYDFKFTYADGSYYYGTVADDGTYGYFVGETINGKASGSYSIYASAGSTGEAAGTVYDTSYYDVTSNQTYTPAYGVTYASYGYKSGTNGLNQDFDYIRSGSGPWVAFGDGGTYEAIMSTTTTLYDFKFTYADGSYYYGTVADNGAYGYHVGETINGTTSGSYNIYASAGTTTQAVGTVYDSSYYDVQSNQTYTPAYGVTYAGLGYKSGTNGLNQDLDYIRSGNGQWHAFGEGGADEAKIPPATLYDFKFTYTDGSYYFGTVADDGTFGFHVGETINGTSSGSYNIYASAGSTSEAVGTVYDTSYYDVTSNQTYAPAYGSIYASYGYVSGTDGLNLDFDYIRSGNGPWVAFGDGGTYEAKLGGGGSSSADPSSGAISNAGLALLTNQMAADFIGAALNTSAASGSELASQSAAASLQQNTLFHA